MAYKHFAAIDKTAEFSLAINWTVGFLGYSNKVDDRYTGVYADTTERLHKGNIL